jgi:2-methylcitrate dehydratase PrpD
MSAYLAQDGFTGAAQVLEGAQGLGVGMSTDADPTRLTDGLGTRWALAETSFKFHASCRHTHPAADALLQVMAQNGLKAGDVERVVTHVHQGAIDVLGRVVVPATVHQGKFSMGTVLGLIAVHGHAGLTEFDRDFLAPEVVAFRDKVMMELDREVDTAYPARWIGKVSVTTSDGRTLSGRVDEPKGDPGNTLSRAEIEDKMKRLTQYGEGATPQEAQALCERIWGLAGEPRVGRLLG